MGILNKFGRVVGEVAGVAAGLVTYAASVPIEAARNGGDWSEASRKADARAAKVADTAADAGEELGPQIAGVALNVAVGIATGKVHHRRHLPPGS
jgi:hypothetical protein